MGKLLLAFLIVPIVELVLIIQVGGQIGVWPTIGLLIVVSVVGAWLVKWQGIFTMAGMRGELVQGRLPGKQLVDGALVLVAGALMLTPGFITDAIGLVLLIPPTRAVVRRILIRRFQGRIQTMTFEPPGQAGPAGQSRPDPDDIIDV